MSYTKEDYKRFTEIYKEYIISQRKRFSGRSDQKLIKEYIGSYSEHDSYKIRLARRLSYTGKKVYIEKYLKLCGIRCRADIAYFENGKWNIIEIEFCRGHKNNILKNINKLRKVANVKVIYI